MNADAPIPNVSQKLTVTIRTTNMTLFEGEAKAITSHSDNGVFDVLPYHAHFICIVKKTIIVHLLNGEKKEFPIESGILQVFNNAVDVFLGIEAVQV